MNNLIYVSLLGILLLIFSSCKKENPKAEVEVVSNQIIITDANTGDCKCKYTYDSQERVLTANKNSCDSINRTSYTYSDNSIIPKKIIITKPADYGYFITMNFDFSPPILTQEKTYNSQSNPRFETTKYILDSELKVLFRLNNTNDTDQKYIYVNNQLTEIVHINSSSDTTFLEYNSKGQLIYVKYKYYNEVLHSYIYQNEKLAGMDFYTIYTYNSGILTQLFKRPKQINYTVTPYYYFEPIQMNPINQFIYPYLHLYSIDFLN